jgi:hypothetical protein
LTFQRLTIVAKNSGKSVSDMLGITDLYERFCIDEASQYLYIKLIENKGKPKESGNNLLNKHAKKK